MDFKTLNVVLSNVLSPENPEANFPVMIRGRHGVGKSEVIYQLARTLGMKVVERRISQMMEGDLEQEMQLYDEHGNPQKFYDQDGNEIPFEEVKQFLMAQQAQQMAM